MTLFYIFCCIWGLACAVAIGSPIRAVNISKKMMEQSIKQLKIDPPSPPPFFFTTHRANQIAENMGGE